MTMAFEADTDEGASAGEGGGKSGGVQQRISFAAAGGSAAGIESSGAGRHAFFRARKLQRVGEVF